MRALRQRHPAHFEHIVRGAPFNDVYQPLLDDVLYYGMSSFDRGYSQFCYDLCHIYASKLLASTDAGRDMGAVMRTFLARRFEDRDAHPHRHLLARAVLAADAKNNGGALAAAGATEASL